MGNCWFCWILWLLMSNAWEEDSHETYKIGWSLSRDARCQRRKVFSSNPNETRRSCWQRIRWVSLVKGYARQPTTPNWREQPTPWYLSRRPPKIPPRSETIPTCNKINNKNLLFTPCNYQLCLSQPKTTITVLPVAQHVYRPTKNKNCILSERKKIKSNRK